MPSFVSHATYAERVRRGCISPNHSRFAVGRSVSPGLASGFAAATTFAHFAPSSSRISLAIPSHPFVCNNHIKSDQGFDRPFSD